jgi:predicted RNA-binding protein (TIGR00451 family)
MDEAFLKRKVAALLNFTYGRRVGDAVTGRPLTFGFSPVTLRLRYVYANDRLLATLRPDGNAMLQRDGLILLDGNKDVTKKVVVTDDAAPYVERGGDVLAGGVRQFVGHFYAGEDVIIASKNGRLIACGQILVLPEEARFFRRGVIIKNRFGVNQNERQVA